MPLATMLSSVTGLPAFFVRKEPKKYGTERLCEGGDIAGRSLLIVEDVVTTGGAVVLSAQDLRAKGAVVEYAVCVIDREGGGAEVVGAEGVAAPMPAHDVRARSSRMSPARPGSGRIRWTGRRRFSSR